VFIAVRASCLVRYHEKRERSYDSNPYLLFHAAGPAHRLSTARWRHADGGSEARRRFEILRQPTSDGRGKRATGKQRDWQSGCRCCATRQRWEEGVLSGQHLSKMRYSTWMCTPKSNCV
jgi:hypothetical protein